jgi:glutamate dehydrogenase (NAD(P)+)
MVNFDNLGPEKILEVYDPKTGMRGIVVLDNTKLGPGKGGIRMTPSVSVEEVFKLARTMTLKNSLAGLPFGGAKAGIIIDPKLHPAEKKEEIIRAFSKAIKVICPSIYIAGPDINTTETEMRQFAESNGDNKSCTGKPSIMGGIPHELGSTGFGVYHSAMVAVNHAKLDIKKLTVSIEGFGNVGWFASKHLAEAGAKIVAVSDSKGTLHFPKGMDFRKLAEVKKREGTVTAYPGGKVLKGEDIVRLESDLLITAAMPDIINERNKDKVKSKIIVEGSNIRCPGILRNISTGRESSSYLTL